MKVYVVTEAASGDGTYDYTPELSILGVFEDYQDAKECYLLTIDDVKESGDSFDDEMDISIDPKEDIATIIDRSADWCRVIKIEETELTPAKL